MKTAMILALSVAFFLGGVVRADLPVGSYAPDIEAKEWINSTNNEPVSLKELKGLVVVLYFWVSFHEGGKRGMNLMNIVEGNPGLGRRRGVYVMGVTDADKAAVQKTILDEKVGWTVACGSEAYKEYRPDSYPHVFVLDTEGRIAWSGFPGQDGGDEMVKHVLDVLAKNPPSITHPAEAELARELRAKSKTAIREKNYREAIKNASDSVDHTIAGDRLRTQCQDVMDLIEAIGNDRVASAEALIDKKNFDEGIALLRTTMLSFKGSDAGKRAKERLEALAKEHEQVQKILEDQKKESAAQGKLADAIEDIKSREVGSGYVTLEEIVSENPGSETARDAQKIMDRMNKNDGIMGHVRDFKSKKECTMLLSQARNLIQVKQYAKAKELLKQLMEKFPDTIWYEDALEEMRKIP